MRLDVNRGNKVRWKEKPWRWSRFGMESSDRDGGVLKNVAVEGARGIALQVSRDKAAGARGSPAAAWAGERRATREGFGSSAPFAEEDRAQREDGVCLVSTCLGCLRSESEWLEGAGVDGSCSVSVESAGIGGPLDPVELDETAASVDGHAALVVGVGFNDLAAVLSVGWGAGRDIV